MRRTSLMASLLLSALMTLTFTACSNAASPEKGMINQGVAPYALSDEQKYVLECLNMEDAVQMIGYHAPEEALSPVSYTHLDVYKRQDFYIPPFSFSWDWWF